MTNHGHVLPRPDGAKARCGGPALCAQCARELDSIKNMSKDMEAISRHVLAIHLLMVVEAAEADPGDVTRFMAGEFLERARASVGKPGVLPPAGF